MDQVKMIQREHIIYSDSSNEKNFRVTQKKNIKKSCETNDIKGFVSFRVKRGIFE